MTPDFSVVTEFEKRIAQFFGSPFAVAVDSCTHGIELCLRMTKANFILSQHHTYLSVPMLANKLGIELKWQKNNWQDFYFVQHNIVDAAVLWKRDSYLKTNKEIFMCVSFQYQKHLSLGRGGIILCSSEESYNQLKKMAYDGRIPGIPWRDQDIDTMGYHYYMTPETASLGLEKLQDAIDTKPRQWVYTDWPDLTQMKIFKK